MYELWGVPEQTFSLKPFIQLIQLLFRLKNFVRLDRSAYVRRTYVRPDPNPADWPYVEPRSRRHKGYPGSGITVRGPDFGSEHYLESYGNIK